MNTQDPSTQPTEVMIFPLSNGGRPAFGARRLLEKMMLSASSGQPGWGLPAKTGYGACATLRAMSNLFANLETIDAQGLLRSWSDLPLLVDPTHVWEWEKDKIWRTTSLHTYQVNAYQDIFHGQSPSNAYNPHDAHPGQDTTWQVWQSFLSDAPRHKVCQILEAGADSWSAWYSRAPDLDQFKSACHTMIWALEKLGFSAQQAQTLTLLEAWWSELRVSFPSTANLLVDMSFDFPNRWLEVCAAAISCHPQLLRELFSVSSPGAIRDFYAPTWLMGSLDDHPDASASRTDKKGLERLLYSRRPAWNKAVEYWHVHSRLPWRTNLKAVESSAQSTVRWEHLGTQFSETVRALEHGARVLVVGPHGSGKTQFSTDLISSAGLVSLPLSTQSRLDDAGKLDALTRSTWEARSVSGGLIFIDQADSFFDTEAVAKWLDRPTGAPLLVVVNDLKNLHAHARERFDKVLFLDDMPLPARLVLARALFDDDDLALRVARSLRTPKSIVDAAQWCRKSNSFTWETVKEHHQSALRAAQNTGWNPSKSIFDTETPSPVDKLPPLAGNPMLIDLLDRLTTAIERPEDFAALGATPPKGAVLIGPPGTGKTLFARHLAARLSAPIFIPDPAKLFESPELVATLFKTAREQSPCVILLDEAEKIACLFPGTPPPSALGSLLTEIDGVQALEGVLVVLTTNNPFIAPPLLRSGRLSEMRKLAPPFHPERVDIWQAYLSRRPQPEGDDTTWPEVLSHASRGFTGADIAEVLRKAAVSAVMAGKKSLDLPTLLATCDDVRWSTPDGSDPLSETQRRAVAIHEAGHALLAWRWNLDVLRITVRSRQDAMGMVQWDAPERSYDLSRAMLFGKTQMMLGGIAAEQAILGQYGAGGSSDLQSSLRTIRNGFAWSGLGTLGPAAAPNDISYWSEAMRQRIEGEVQVWSKLAFDEAASWLAQNANLVEDLATRLLELGDMSGPELDVFANRVRAVSALPAIPALSVPTHHNLAVHQVGIEKSTTNPDVKTLHTNPGTGQND